ncbi:MAG: 4-hydroxy-tetrahydrodipicolinate synthase [Puniceicoccales bacterium]|jgi:4-hydroxy-tetrahydrodipicolinate synthase|nr:4-hydroxy-tetrahydrodipicolinate synthase [Puniceicoccales bacterium]
MPIKGLYTALVTPFVDGEINLNDFRRLISFQAEGGADGIVVAGTTGESPTLTGGEFISLLETAVANGKQMKVLAGVGSCSTTEAVRKTKIAHDMGVSGMLAVTPYYNRPTQSGLVEYYSRIADATDRPIILYSVPSRCGVEIAIDTISTLRSRCSNIVGIKEATENCSRVEKITDLMGEDFAVFSGNDSMTLPFMSLGAVGVVSVMSNITPSEMAKLVAFAGAGDFRDALHLYRTMQQMISKLFIETNPLPVKFLLEAKGIISSAQCRSPLGELSKSSVAELSKLPI